MKMHSVRRSCIAISLAIALIFVFVGCSLTQSTSSRTVASTPTITPTVVSPTGSPTTDRHFTTYTDPVYRFSIDIPNNTQQANQGYNSTTRNADSEWYEVPDIPGHAFFLQIMTYPFPSVNQTGICQIATPVTISPKITGYQITRLQPTASDQAHGMQPVIEIYFFAHGIAIYVSMMVPDQQFTKQLETIWHHMLTSFVPRKVVLDTHPCNN